jgi:trans-aconitate methyltransferase
MPWRSYDDVAEVYASVAERLYFAAPARDLVSLLQLRQSDMVLDIGTGTGVVAAAALERVRRGSVVGCDPAVSMLRLAQAHVPTARFTAAALPQIPFHRHVFHAVTLGFVLSHVADLVGALVEVGRVLVPGGRVGVSSWSLSPGASAPGRAWQAMTLSFVEGGTLQEATTRALPWEEQLSSPEVLANVLQKGGLEDVQIEQRIYPIQTETHEYVQSRLISIPSRYMLALLPPNQWQQFVKDAHDALEGQFGETLRFEVSINFATARSAA